MSLAVFDISKAVENGVEITPEIDPSSGTIRYVTLVVVYCVDLSKHSQPPQAFQVLY
jgi:hypothetical protein